jgi:tryptophan synthase alpha chain
LLVPDIPLEETDSIREMCNKHGIELVLLTTPTTPQVGQHAGRLGRELRTGTNVRMFTACVMHFTILMASFIVQGRMSTIAKASQGFVYLVSVTGVTGMKEQVSTRVEGLVKMLHGVTDKPVSAVQLHVNG